MMKLTGRPSCVLHLGLPDGRPAARLLADAAHRAGARRQPAVVAAIRSPIALGARVEVEIHGDRILGTAYAGSAGESMVTRLPESACGGNEPTSSAATLWADRARPGFLSGSRLINIRREQKIWAT